MTADRWTQIEPLFEAALDRPAGARADWLAAVCPDPDLRREVADLLAASEKAARFLEAPALVFAEDLADEDGAPLRVGPYRLLREIGRGGMSVVYLAARADGQYEQEVAVKVLRRSLDAGERHRRFLAERQILATLRHPHIARLLDGGVTGDGRPYLVMAHVPGRPITDYCRERGLPLRARLRLFASVCDAVQYAHQQLVVHRDLKPSNILVTDDGEVKLLDFGIAKLLDPDAAGAPRTRTGLYPMTPEYASPEQVRGEPVSTASDVYQLGLLLYELLTDRRPYRFHGGRRYDVERAILEQEPEPPSRAVGRAGERARRLRGDLDRIVLKALRKEPERRYSLADALARDIERHLAGLPVEARPATLAYRLSTFVRRHRAGVATAAVVLALGAASMVRVAAERDRAEAEAARAARVSAFLLDMLSRADAPATDTGALLRLLEPAVARADSELAGDPGMQAAVFYTLGQLYRRVGRPDQAGALLERALSLQRAVYPGPHEEEAATLYALGLLQWSRPDSARALFEASAAMRRALTPHDDHDLAWSLLQAARTFPRGHPDKPERYREALAMLERLHGSRSPEVAEAIHEYHALGTADGTPEDYRAAYEEVLGIYAESGREKTPSALAAMYNLGLLYEREGDDARAFPWFRRAIRVGRDVLPPGSPLLITMTVNYGASLHEQERFGEADSVLRDVAEITLRTLPDSASSIAHSHYWHGRNLLALNRPAEAEEALRTADAVYRHIRAGSPRHLRAQVELAEALARQGRHAEAEATFEHIAAREDRRGGTGPPPR